MPFDIALNKLEIKKNSEKFNESEVDYANISYNKNSRFQIKNNKSNKCLDATKVHKVGGHYHLWDCDITNKNQWFGTQLPNIQPHGGTGYLFFVGPKGLCVTANNFHNGREAARLEQEECNAGINGQMWRDLHLKSLYKEGRTHLNFILETRTVRVMSPEEGKSNNGTPIMGMERDNSPAQIWRIEFVQTRDERKIQLQTENDLREKKNFGALLAPCQ